MLNIHLCCIRFMDSKRRRQLNIYCRRFRSFFWTEKKVHSFVGVIVVVAVHSLSMHCLAMAVFCALGLFSLLFVAIAVFSHARLQRTRLLRQLIGRITVVSIFTRVKFGVHAFYIQLCSYIDRRMYSLSWERILEWQWQWQRITTFPILYLI